MQFPTDPTQVWPPDNVAKLYEKYREHSAWYSSDPLLIAAAFAEQVSTPTPRGRFWATDVEAERRIMIHVPLAAKIAAMSSNLLFAEPVAFTFDKEETAAWFDGVSATAGFNKTFLRAGELSSALGGVFLRVSWDAQIAPWPILTFVRADAAVAFFKLNMLHTVIFWHVVRNDGDHVYRLLERLSLDNPGLAEFRLFKGSLADGARSSVSNRVGSATDLVGMERGAPTGAIGVEVPLDSIPETAGQLDVVETFLTDSLPVEYVCNKPNRTKEHPNVGSSDYRGIEGLMDAVDEAVSDWSWEVRASKARLLVHESALTITGAGVSAFDVVNEILVGMAGPLAPGDVKPVQAIQFDIRDKEFANTVLGFERRASSLAGFSPQTLGIEMDGVPESGRAIRLKERTSYTTSLRLQSVWAPALSKIIEKMLEINSKVQLHDKQERPPPEAPKVRFSDSILNEPLEMAEVVEIERRAGVISVDQGVRDLRPEWTDEQVREEVARIAGETVFVEDPMQVGLPEDEPGE